MNKSPTDSIFQGDFYSIPTQKVLCKEFGGFFEEEISQVEPTLCQIKNQIDLVFPNQTEIEKIELLAIVYPEILRYSQLQDFIETTALEFSYLNGSNRIDFSIGQFQMKPSFVESLLPHESRKSIIENLKTVEGQLNYLDVFRKQMLLKYGLESNPTLSRVETLATLYNLGPNTIPSQVRNYQKEKHFPYGYSFDGDQYSYSHIAAQFWTLNTQQHEQ